MWGNTFQSWEVLKSRELFVAEPWIRLSVQEVRLPDGKIVNDYYQVRFPEYAMIFAQTADGEVIVERQYKHGAGRVSLVLPAGLIEDREDPLMAAQRELLEETGYIADEWRLLGRFVVHGNYGCGQAHLFVAQNSHRVTDPNSGDLEEMEIVRMKPEEVVDAVCNGDVAPLSSAAAIALATNPLFVSRGG